MTRVYIDDGECKKENEKKGFFVIYAGLFFCFFLWSISETTAAAAACGGVEEPSMDLVVPDSSLGITDKINRNIRGP